MKRITVEDGVKDELAEAVKAAELAERLEAKVAGIPPTAPSESDVLDQALANYISDRHERIATLAEELSR